MSKSATPGLDVSELLEHAEWLRRLALHLVRDPDDADDLAQLAMETALVSPPKQPGALQPWLGGLLRNLARMHWRSDSRRRRREQSAELAQTEMLDPDQLLEKARAFERVARSVTELREPFRTVVLLRYYEGLSSAEIARRLDVPAATVRSRLKSGLDSLRGELRRDGERPAWAPILAPGATLPLANGGGIAAATQGALVLKGLTKAAVVLVLIIAAVFGTRALGIWGDGNGDGDGEVAKLAKGAVDDSAPRKVANATVPTQFAPVAVGPPVLNSADPLGGMRLEGQVIDDQERAIGGATIALNSHPPQVVISEDDGSFAFSRLIGREYALEASSGNNYAGIVRLRLRADTEPVILRVRPSRKVTVRVVDDSDAPVVGASVELRSQLTWSGVTNTSGELVLQGVGASDPVVVVSAKGFARVARRLVLSRKEETARVQLRRGVGVSGRVVDAAGRPVAGARVLGSSASEPFEVLTPERDGTETDAKGNWSTEALSPGIYRFRASHGRFASASLPPISVQSSIQGLEITLRAGSEVAGRVVDESGEPISGADVRILAAGSVHWRPARRAFSDASGAFRVESISSSEVDVVASHQRGSSQVVALELPSKEASGLVLKLVLNKRIAGLVVDSEGQPIVEAQVRIDREGVGTIEQRREWMVRGQTFAMTDGTGRFSFNGLPDGAYRVRASRSGARHTLWVGEGVVARPGSKDVEIVLPSDSLITGTVLFESGEAPATFLVGVGGGRLKPFSGGRGGFEIDAPPGKHVVMVRGPSFADTAVSARVESGKPTELGTVTVKPGRSLSGRVFDASGRAVADAEVAAGKVISGDGSQLFIKDQSPGGRSTRTDASGGYVLTGFPPGRLTVVAAKDGVGRSSSLTLRGGNESTRVDLILEDIGTLSGVVTLDGKPLANTIVIATPEAATTSNFFVATGADGSFAFDQLTAGNYIVYPMIGSGGGPQDMHILPVILEAGTTATANIPIATGPLTLDVVITTDDASPMAFAQVFVIGASYNADRGSQLLDGGRMVRELGLDRPVATLLRPAPGGRTSATKLVPGTYTVCVIPIPINPDDPMAAAKDLRTKMETFPVKCETLELKSDQRVSMVVPGAWTRPADPQ